MRLVNNAEDFLNILASQHTLLIKSLVKIILAIHETKPVLTFNKPIYVGFAGRDLSTWKMYDFHYNFIEKNFNAELLFTDRDSLTYEIKSRLFMNNFLSGKICLTLLVIRKIQSFLVRLIKDEFRGVIVIETVGLKSKMYSM